MSLLQVDFSGQVPPEQTPASPMEGFGAQLSSKYKSWADARRPIEDEWIKDLRAYHGLYEPDIEAALKKRGGSQLYMHLTRTKVQAAYARIVDLLSDDRPWGISPTPIPDLTPEKKALIRQITVQQTGQLVSPAEVLPLAKQIADSAAQAMEELIADQLAEAEADGKIKMCVLEMCVLGSGALAGVQTQMVEARAWSKEEAGAWASIAEETPAPMIRSASVFDIYPDPFAASLKDAEGVFERHALTRQHLLDLAKTDGFDADQIRAAAAETPNFTALPHEVERRRLTGSNVETLKSSRYDVLSYWGSVTGKDLVDCSCEVPDKEAEYQANIWICGQRILSAKLNPYQPHGIPYMIVPYEVVPHQVWGVGIPRMMRDSQSGLNTSARAAMDELASGNQLEVNANLLHPTEKAVGILHRNRIWMRDGGDPSQPLLRIHQMPNNSSAFLNMMEVYRRFADEETNLPSYTHGEQLKSLNQTASGTSMLMAAANVVTKSVIKHIDDYLFEPLITKMYNWNMQHSDDESIKGDMKIIAKGSAALVAKEVQSQRLMQFAQIASSIPPLAGQIDWMEVGREIAVSLEVNVDKIFSPRGMNAQQDIAPGGPGNPVTGPPPGMGAAGGIPPAPSVGAA